MSGHSKWANIKHKKDAVDRQRGKMFSRATRDIILAVKQGGPDAATNLKLRAALIGARAVNMPNANIDRAVKKAAGDTESDNFAEIVYEAYGPGGTGILISCLTDNRNRTACDVRMALDRNNGSLATSGSVSRMFHRKCHFLITGDNATEDKLFEPAIDAGAEDFEAADGTAEIWGPPEAFVNIATALEKLGVSSQEAGISMKPESKVEITEPEIAKRVLRLIDKLDEIDDVQEVFANFDIADEALEGLG